MKKDFCPERVDAWLEGAVDEAVWKQHLTDCDGCRRELEGYQALFRVLCEESEAEPAFELDRIVRSAMPDPRPLLRPGLAIGIGAAAWLAALAAAVLGVSAAGFGENGPGIALGLLAGYAMFTAVATVPLLIRRTTLTLTE